MRFDGTEGGPIPLKEGAEMTATFRRKMPKEVKGAFFGKDILNKILAQDGCMGIRMYFALDREGVLKLVLAGADAETNDMLDLVANISIPCPNVCGKQNPLNS